MLSVKRETYHFVPSGASGARMIASLYKVEVSTRRALTSVWVRMFAVSEIRLSLGEDLGERTRVVDVSARVDEEGQGRHYIMRNIVHGYMM